MRISLTTRQWVFTILGIILVIYVIFQARFLLLGPELEITYPRDATEVDDALLEIRGTAQNVAWLTLNGRQIYTDENGFWNEKLLLSPGTSIMTLNGRDRFGREDKTQVRVILITKASTSTPKNDQEQEN